ncbi:MAG: carboxylating nicotinate-nucleotide diphosphorylase [Melioribacteraceae bacterium]|nr:carboxylating nicotinate-nucleotide diphosphorylase [Melioribacteraceae bacterium]
MLDDIQIERIIDLALDEDIQSGDITTEAIINKSQNADAFIKAKENGVIAGLPIAEKVFRKLDPDLIWNPLVNDGDKIKSSEILVKFSGNYSALLTAERTALNFLQRMSGIATQTNLFVSVIKDSKTKILDTRKTIPGHRLLDKYSVKMGGGTNHRIGLYDLVMIKDNHIKVAGNITNAVDQIRRKYGNKFRVEIETTNLDEVNEALKCNADIIMLDNMTNEAMNDAVKLINGRAQTEASGNMTIERIKSTAEIGVDFISIGMLTHSVKALDISMYIE